MAEEHVLPSPPPGGRRDMLGRILSCLLLTLRPKVQHEALFEVDAVKKPRLLLAEREARGICKSRFKFVVHAVAYCVFDVDGTYRVDRTLERTFCSRE